MADVAYQYRDILKFYYPLADLSLLSETVLPRDLVR
jgi:hypothetical protein